MAIDRRKFLALLGMGAPAGFFGKRLTTLRGLREYFLNHGVSAVPEASTDYGPLTPLLKDEIVSDILVNRYDRIYVERAGKLEFVAAIPAQFDPVVTGIGATDRPCGRGRKAYECDAAEYPLPRRIRRQRSVVV